MSRKWRRDLKCPHCGKTPIGTVHGGDLTAMHRMEGGADCPGSRQIPRYVGDRRPLWRDERREAAGEEG